MQELKDLHYHCKKIVSLFKTSSVCAAKLVAAQTENMALPVKLISDNETRWNSFLNMIERILKIKDHLTLAFEKIHLDNQISGKEKKTKNFSQQEYEDMNFLTYFLQPFRIATKHFEEFPSNRISISSIIPTLVKLLEHCRKCKGDLENVRVNDDDNTFELLNCVTEVLIDMEERWGNINIIFYCATYLHPYFKKLSFLEDEKIMEIKNYVKQKLSEIPEAEENAVRGSDISFLWGIDNSLSNNKDELELYDQEAAPNKYDKGDLLEYWSRNRDRYPRLSLFAKDLFSIQSSTAQVERDFSFLGEMISDRRTRLRASKIEKSMFIYKNLHFLPDFVSLFGDVEN